MMRTPAIAIATLVIVAALLTATGAARLTAGHNSSSPATTQSLPDHSDDGFDWH
jgi:hypothetical protein